MDMNGQERIEAPIETVWRALNDPEVLRACIPGCETLDKLCVSRFVFDVKNTH